MKNTSLILALALILSLGQASAQIEPSSFKQPEPRTHVIAWWHWLNGNITRQGITRDLEAMKAVGITQATVLNVWRDMPDADVPNKVRFGTPEWWGMLRYAMQEADRLGMTMGAANCDGWSESGGPWITPELSMKNYTFSKTKVTCEFDGRKRKGNLMEVALPLPPCKMDYYRDVCVLVFPDKEVIDPRQVVDVTRYVDIHGVLRWTFGQGEWTVLRFGYTTTGKTNNPATWEGRGLECDKMDTTALNVHFANYPQKVLQLAQEVNPRVFRYFLVDSWEAGPQTWTQRFPEEFQKRRGYDIRPWLPALCDETIIDSRHTEAFLFDFRKTIGDLVEECYFKHMADLCHRNGVQMYSEGIYGETKNPPVDVLKTYKYCDVPMTEFWARVTANDYPYTYNPWPSKTFIYPVHSSLLYDKPIIGSEAYTGYALFSDSPIDLKTYGDVAFCEGVNSMMLHSYVHQPTEQRPGMTLGVYGQSFNRNNTWFGEAGSWFEFQSRVQYMLRQGVRRSDVLVFTGDRLPCPQWTPEVSDSIMQGIKFNYINPDVLLSSRLTAHDGQLWLDERYPFQCLVVRDSLMELATLQKLAKLVEDGARVFGPKPVHTLSLTHLDENDRALRTLADEVWSKPSVCSEVMDLHQQVKPDLRLPGVAPDDVAYIHRQTAEEDIYYLANKSYSRSVKMEAEFRVAGGEVSLWDPMDGQVYAAVSRSQGDYSVVPLTLKPQQSLFVVFSKRHFGANPIDDYPTREHVLSESTGTMHFVDDSTIADRTIGPFRSLTEFEEASIRYYSGRVTYTIPVDLSDVVKAAPRKVLLELPAFGSTARVVVNGHEVGTVWMPNAGLDITEWVHRGANTLVITVTNPWRNRMIGDKIQQGGFTWTSSPTTIKNDPLPVIRTDARLLPSGISRPIRILY